MKGTYFNMTILIENESEYELISQEQKYTSLMHEDIIHNSYMVLYNNKLLSFDLGSGVHITSFNDICHLKKLLDKVTRSSDQINGHYNRIAQFKDYADFENNYPELLV